MLFKRLIFIAFASMYLLFPAGVSASEGCLHSEAGINRTDDRPQRQDVGMNDILAVTGGCTLTPPNTVRVVHDSPTGTVATSQAAQLRHYSKLMLLPCSRLRAVNGYIYMIRCLRL